jgi:hypothetical protein
MNFRSNPAGPTSLAWETYVLPAVKKVQCTYFEQIWCSASKSWYVLFSQKSSLSKFIRLSFIGFFFKFLAFCIKNQWITTCMAKIEDYFKLELFTLGFTLRCYLQFEFLSNSLNKHIFLLDLLINTKLYNCVDHCECFNPINQLMVNVQQVECGSGL